MSEIYATADSAETSAQVVESTLDELIYRNGANSFTSNQSLGGNKLTNVGSGTADGDSLSYGQSSANLADLTVDTGALTFTGTAVAITPSSTITLSLVDNLANSYLIKEGANNYFDINTTNNSERISYGNTLTGHTFNIDSSRSSAFRVQDASLDYLRVDSGTPTTIKFGNTLSVFEIYILDAYPSSFRIMESTNEYLNIRTSNGTEKLTFGNTLTAHEFAMRDNDASTFKIAESTNTYLDITTTNASEKVTYGNTLTSHEFTLKDNGATVFKIAESTNTYLDITTTDTSEKVTYGNTLTSHEFTLKDNGATVFKIAESTNTYLDITTTDASEKVTYGNTLTAHVFNIKDNNSGAFEITEDAREYLKIITTNGSEKISIGNATVNNDVEFLGTGNVTHAGDIVFTATNTTPTITQSDRGVGSPYDLTISAQYGDQGGVGADLYLKAGSTTDSKEDGGDIYLTPGASAGGDGGEDGYVIVTDGAGTSGGIIIPYSNGTGHVGTPQIKWEYVFADNVVGADYCFTDTICPICNALFQEGDNIIFNIYKQEIDDVYYLNRTIPVHISCALTDVDKGKLNSVIATKR